MVDAVISHSAATPTVTTFGEFLKFLRRRARMTQRELSIAVGYSISQISRLEQNERLPDEMTIRAVFVPALGLEREQELVAQLVALAHHAHTATEPTTPASLPPPAPALIEAQPIAGTPSQHNLPSPRTSLIGRAAECTAIRQQLATARLVTLTGFGGVGKTRLALAVAQSILDGSTTSFGFLILDSEPAVPSDNQKSKIQNPKFPDGLWFVELAALHEAALAPATLLATFQLAAAPGRTATDALLLYLKQKQMLLVLDNCEHLIATCADLVDRILRTCPGITILATSREALNVEGEVEWPVKPLTTPALFHPHQGQPTAAELHGFAAVQLFLARAATSRADWQLTDQNAPAVAQICTHLDGIPLAIELAAARLKGLTVEEIAARLDDRFTLLTDGRRPALLRHQTLRAAVDWSYDLLSEPEQQLLCRLGVFAGGWTLAAADALVAGEQAPGQTLALLLQLVNKSLVVVDERDGESRYHLLETIRQYANTKLQEAGEAEQARHAHFSYFLALVEQSWEPAFIGPRLSTWLNRIVLEADNLRVAFTWACQQPDRGEGALRLAGALGIFWIVRGEFTEGRQWLERALACDQGAPPVARAWALARLADLYRLFVQARVAMIEEALTLFTAAHAPAGMSYCLQLLAAVGLYTASSPQAIAQLQQSIQLARTCAHPLLTGTGLWILGDAYAAHGQPAQAITAFEECLAIGNQYGERLLLARPMIRLSAVDAPRALQHCQAALHRPQADLETEAALLQTLGRIQEENGHFAEAQSALSAALALWRQLGIKWSMSGGITRALLDLGIICFWTKADAEAVRYMLEAQQHYTEVGDGHGVAWTQVIIGYVALRQQQWPAALNNFRASLRHSADSSMNYLPLALCGLATTVTALGKTEAAFRLLGAATHFENKCFALDAPAQNLFLQTLADARQQLHDPILAAAWRAGELMSVEQAVAYALQQSSTES